VLALGLGLSNCAGPPGPKPEKCPLPPVPVHYGLSLPCPLSAPIFDSLPRHTGQPALRLAETVLEIDRRGKVVAVTFPTSEDSAAASSYAGALRTLAFRPGSRAGLATDMKLLVRLRVGDTARPPVAYFPVDNSHVVTNGNLYFDALALNGVTPPAIDEFPSYYFRFPPEVSPRARHFKLFRVALDSAGWVRGLDLVKATGDEFNHQIRSAVNWGRFRPLLIDGRPLPCSAFVLVSLYPQTEYPTAKIYGDSLATTTRPEAFDVRVLPDTVGWMSDPRPWVDWSGPIIDSDRVGLFEGVISARITVDTTGAGRVGDYSVSSWTPASILGEKAYKHRFHPALDHSLRPIAMNGLVLMQYVDASNVRIWFKWLSPSSVSR